MKLSWSTFWQAVAWAAALGSTPNVAVVPAKYRPYVLAVSAIAGILLHLHAGQFNPDGTPAECAYKPKG